MKCTPHSSTSEPAAPHSSARGSTRSKPSVVVVGAGLAGLSAAQMLAENGHEVHVLEAAARPGGRILTIRSPLVEGQYVEAGASHVINDPALLALCQRMALSIEQFAPTRGLQRVSLLGGQRAVRPANQRGPSRYVLSVEEERLGEQGRMQRYFAESEQFDPTLPPPASFAHLDALSGAELLLQRGASPGYIAQADDMLGLSDAGIQGMSALAMLQQWSEILREIKLGGNGRIVGGCDRLPVAIAQALGERVLYEAEVRAIEQDAHEARVAFTHKGKNQVISADRVVVAIPPALLARLALSPALPTDKVRALREIELENVTRAWVQTSDRFWAARGESGRVDSDAPLGPVRDESDGMAGNAGILGLYVKRGEARRLAELADSAREQAVLDYLEQAQPGTTEKKLGSFSKCWSSDPYQRGAYVSFKVGQFMTFGPILTRSEGRLHFAGDHTSHRPGFMHGALASAQRAVDEVSRATAG